jgi:hypothetical protein
LRVDWEDAQRGVGPGGGAGLANRLAQARSSSGDGILQEPSLVAGRRPEPLDRKPQLLRWRRDRLEVWCQREPHPHGVGKRVAEHNLLAPGTAALDQHRGEHHRAQGAASPFAPREQAVD